MDFDGDVKASFGWKPTFGTEFVNPNVWIAVDRRQTMAKLELVGLNMVLGKIEGTCSYSMKGRGMKNVLEETIIYVQHADLLIISFATTRTMLTFVEGGRRKKEGEGVELDRYFMTLIHV